MVEEFEAKFGKMHSVHQTCSNAVSKIMKSLKHKDAKGNPVKWTNHITSLIVGIFILILGLLVTYAYFRKF